MISKAATTFWRSYPELPDHIQRLADKNHPENRSWISRRERKERRDKT